MGQKTNPISLRTNRDFDDCWYSDYYYSSLLSTNIATRYYLNSIFKQINYSSARIYLQNFQKKTKIFVFFCSSKKSRKIRSKLFNLKYRLMVKKKKNERVNIRNFREKLTNNIGKNLYFRFFLLQPFFYGVKTLSIYENLLKNRCCTKSTAITVNARLYSVDSLGVKTITLKKRNHINAILGNTLIDPLFNESQMTFRNHFESILFNEFNIDLNIYPIKINNDFRSALFLADSIIYYLQRRVNFRRIKNRLIKEVSQHSGIKGIRITCSGRIGGRSKKAQKAKRETIKYGQTSLHVFSSYIDYASKTAFTSFGSLGVKVWISYQPFFIDSRTC